MPLIRLAEGGDGRSDVDAYGDPSQVVVCWHEGRSVGLVVDGITDGLELGLLVQSLGLDLLAAPGVSGTRLHS